MFTEYWTKVALKLERLEKESSVLGERGEGALQAFPCGLAGTMPTSALKLLTQEAHLPQTT